MPVRKFRDVSEMEETLWREPGDPALFRAISSVWSFAEKTCPQRFPPGVYKHRSIEDAQALAEEWSLANFRSFQERQRARAQFTGSSSSGSSVGSSGSGSSGRPVPGSAGADASSTHRS